MTREQEELHNEREANNHPVCKARKGRIMASTIAAYLRDARANFALAASQASRARAQINEEAMRQLHTAERLLDKGYELDELVEPLLEKYGDVEKVPKKSEVSEAAHIERKAMQSVILECLNDDCSATASIPFDDTMPIGTVKIRSYCPEHIPTGCKDCGEECFDANGRELSFQRSRPS